MVWDVLASVMQLGPMAMRGGTNASSVRAVERVQPPADRLPVLEAPLPSPIATLQIGIEDAPIPPHALGNMRERHRQRSAVVGAFDWSMATLQRRVDRSGPTLTDTGPVSKSWSAGTEAGWTSSGGDRLSIGGRYTIDRALTTIVTSRHLHTHGGTSIAEIGWDHRRDWRLALGYRTVGGGASSLPLERGIDIANGAASRERGVQATFTMRLSSLGARADGTIGAQVVRATVAADEPLRGATGTGANRSVSMFLRTGF